MRTWRIFEEKTYGDNRLVIRLPPRQPEGVATDRHRYRTHSAAGTSRARGEPLNCSFRVAINRGLVGQRRGIG